MFQATLLLQTDVLADLLPDHASYESSEGLVHRDGQGPDADLALPMVTCKAGDGHDSIWRTARLAAAAGGAADPNAPCAHVDLSGSSAWEQNDDLHFSFRFQVDHFTPFAQIHVRALPSSTATGQHRAPTARRRPRALLRRRFVAAGHGGRKEQDVFDATSGLLTPLRGLPAVSSSARRFAERRQPRDLPPPAAHRHARQVPEGGERTRRRGRRRRTPPTAPRRTYPRLVGSGEQAGPRELLDDGPVFTLTWYNEKLEVTTNATTRCPSAR